MRVGGRFELLDHFPDALDSLLERCVLRHKLLQFKKKRADTVGETNSLTSPGPPLSRHRPLATRSGSSGVHAKHRRVMSLERFPVAQIHVHAARQAGVETPDSSHDVYAFELVRAILFEDGRV